MLTTIATNLDHTHTYLVDFRYFLALNIVVFSFKALAQQEKLTSLNITSDNRGMLAFYNSALYDRHRY